ncbi:MAG: glycosyltransferase family 2 protein [Planctomycetota bacterium]
MVASVLNMQGHTKDQFFTVVIPTRERCDTLEHALHTCVIQDYGNLEIIVSDNFSQDDTKDVVASFRDPRIRYLNTGKRLSMTDNFEFALSHIRPEGYVIYIGDDDGLLPNAIHAINTVIGQTQTRVMRWDLPTYCWPSMGGRGANQMHIPALGPGIHTRVPAATIRNVIALKADYRILPMLYMNSAIAYETIKDIKDISGRFYHSMTPDVYSGFAIAGTVDSYIDSIRPYTIGGCSHHSIGASGLGGSLSSEANRKYLSEDNLPFHSGLVMCRSLTVLIAECFLQARDKLPFFRGFTLDMDKIIIKMMEEAAIKPNDIYADVSNAVLRIGQLHNIPEVAQHAIAANPNIGPGFMRKPTVVNLGRAGLYVAGLFIMDLYKGSFHLDCTPLSVKNIYDAALLCEHVIRLKDMGGIGCAAVLKSSLGNIKRQLFPAIGTTKH